MMKYTENKQDCYAYAMNKKLARIRHEETEYDKFDVFFNSMIKHRQRLNRRCAEIMRNKISRDTFDQDCREIIADANLYRKRNQRHFVRTQRDELEQQMPFATDKYLTQMAEKQLWMLMKRQNRRNEERNRKNMGCTTRKTYIED